MRAECVAPRAASAHNAIMDPEFTAGFSEYVDASAARMRTMSDAAAAAPRKPGAWSPKQIVGHLIDSAANNQTRFVRAQLQQDLVFPGYDQDAWVSVQRYQDRSWPELIDLWRAYNHQIAAIMRSAAPADLTRARARHNLREIAFEQLPDGAAATLEYLMRDYVTHLKHHVQQILA
jgi:DinB superfamily